MDKAILLNLRDAGIRYVRWAFAGSYDEGGIVEVKLFDARETVLREINIYESSSEKEKNDLDSTILRIGEESLDGIRGFEINDGGYGWILLDTDSGEMTISENHNVQGIGSEYFDIEDFDRVEILSNPDWTENQTDAASVDVQILIKQREYEAESTIKREIMVFSEFSDDEKENFLSFTRRSGGKKRKNFFEAGGVIECVVSGEKLLAYLTSLGISLSDKLYYKTIENEEFSVNQNDILTELKLFVNGYDYIEHLCVIFVSGWHSDFDYDVKHEAEVVDQDPLPSALLSSR